MIIDFHTHVFPDRIARGAIAMLSSGGGIPPHSDGTEAGLLLAMGEAGVTLSVNLPVLTRAEQFDGTNRYVAEMNKKYDTGRGILSFAGVHPDLPDPEAAIAAVKEMGFLGIKIHPDYQGTFIDDSRYVRILSLAKAAGLITVTHSGVDVAFRDRKTACTPKRVLNLLDRLGGYEKLVLAHIGANEMTDEVYSELCGEDVYFDTAYTLHDTSEEKFLKILKKHGEDKILFATDSPWRNVAEEVKIIKKYALGSAEEKIFSLNAKRLLGLP